MNTSRKKNFKAISHSQKVTAQGKIINKQKKVGDKYSLLPKIILNGNQPTSVLEILAQGIKYSLSFL